MKLLAVLATFFSLITLVSAKDVCCNFTNGGQCIQYCPGKGSLANYATFWAIHPANKGRVGIEEIEEEIEKARGEAKRMGVEQNGE